MPDHARYQELGRQLSAIGVVKRSIVRNLPHDCPAGSAAVLTMLRHRGATHLSGLADMLSIDVSVTSRHVSHAVDQGWVERTRDPADKRSWTLSLTAAGRSLLDEISDRTTRLLADRMSDWSVEEIDRLTAHLARLHDDFADCRPADQGQSRHQSQDLVPANG